MNFTSIKQHNIEIKDNLKYWESKPVLRKIYQQFYKLIAQHVRQDINGKIVEIGSGIGNLKLAIPESICTDIFPNPWIDQVENAYNLSFPDMSISNLILFDVWHHLEYPGTVLKEFYRVLTPGGRIIIFEPAMSLLGFIVYGIFHHEPIKYISEIKWWAPEDFSSEKSEYYAAQGNASRIFCSKKFNKRLTNWNRVLTKKISSISYAASGGYRGKKLYPDVFSPLLSFIDRICDHFPVLFATRLLLVMEKKDEKHNFL
jgi:SAM-dependent methyltransferase